MMTGSPEVSLPVLTETSLVMAGVAAAAEALRAASRAWGSRATLSMIR